VWWVPVEPTDDELEAAYRRTAQRDEQVHAEWEGTSREANQHLGEVPQWDAKTEEPPQ
jgi:hypothetical protein